MVSVILVTYNSEKFIKECLDALIKQNYNNIEILNRKIPKKKRKLLKYIVNKTLNEYGETFKKLSKE